MDVYLSKEDALKMINCENHNEKPNRIAKRLKVIGMYDDVTYTGRGSNVVFTCIKSNDELRNYYDIFKQICIFEYGFDAKTDFNKLLEYVNYNVINYNNKRAETLEEIANNLNMSERVLKKYRSKLVNKIIKDIRLCDKTPYVNSIDNVNEYKELAVEYYNNMILTSYYSQLHKLNKKFENTNNPYLKVALIWNNEINDFTYLFNDEDDYEIKLKSMHNLNTKVTGEYFVFSLDRNGRVLKNNEYPILNEWFTRALFSMILRGNNINNVVWKYIHTVTDEFMMDTHMKNIVLKAIEYINI